MKPNETFHEESTYNQEKMVEGERGGLIRQKMRLKTTATSS